MRLSGLEINSGAAETLRNWGGGEVIEIPLLEYKPEQKWKFVLTYRVLIHLNPEMLP